MNRTVVFVVFAVVAGGGIFGTLYLLLERPDATATFTAFVVQILGLLVVAAGTFYGLGKVNEKLATVEKQTNGNLTALRTENLRLSTLLVEHGINPTPKETP